MSPYLTKHTQAVLDLWATKRFDTYDIAQLLMMREADVERIIHVDREARRSWAA